MSIGNFPKSLSQAILAGRFLVGRLGVHGATQVSREGGGVGWYVGLCRGMHGGAHRHTEAYRGM